MIRYTVRREELATHLEQVREVYADLERLRPDGLAYATYQLEDEVSFLEVLSSEAGPDPLTASAAFREFRSTLDARCQQMPELVEVQRVGTFPHDEETVPPVTPATSTAERRRE